MEHVHAGDLRVKAAEPNILKAFLMGLVASIVCCLIWYGWVVLTNRVWAMAAILFGMAIGGAVRAGGGDRASTLLQWMSATLALVAMLVGEYLIVRHHAVAVLARDGITHVPWILPLDKMAGLVWAGVKSSPFMPLFWIISVGLAAAIPGKEFPGGAARRRS